MPPRRYLAKSSSSSSSSRRPSDALVSSIASELAIRSRLAVERDTRERRAPLDTRARAYTGGVVPAIEDLCSFSPSFHAFFDDIEASLAADATRSRESRERLLNGVKSLAFVAIAANRLASSDPLGCDPQTPQDLLREYTLNVYPASYANRVGARDAPPPPVNESE